MKHFLITFVLCSVVASSYAQQIIYVKRGAAAPGNGASWATAFPDLQQALTVAAGTSGQKEIWVAAGEYKPTSDINRTATFNIPPQTFLYGGFIGNEIARTTRDWRKAHRTILSGDLGAQFDDSDNSYHVVTARNADNTSGLDGFIIKYGNADGSAGANHYNSGGGLLIVNTSSADGPVINQCEFYENKAVLYGGGLASISDGAAVTAKITNTFFSGNHSATGGGAANHKVTGNNTTSYINCVFSTNHASVNGGGMSNTTSDVSVINCTFSKNNSISDGGGIYNSSTSATSVKNSILWKNFKGSAEAGSIQSQVYNSSASPIVQNNIIQGGYGVTADKNTNADPKFRTEPSFEGVYPRASGIPSGWTDRKYEGFLDFNGPGQPRAWPYYTYMDHEYNKMYLLGPTLQLIDFNNLVDNKPTSSLYVGQMGFTKMHRVERSIHTESNRIYFASHNTAGIFFVDRATGILGSFDPMDGELPHWQVELHDLVVDDANDLLYATLFYLPTVNDGERRWYGTLELDLNTFSKRWINTTSLPVSMPAMTWDDEGGDRWGQWRLFLDEPENTLYVSTGNNGVWWWNRGTNATGIINMAGGLPLQPGNPGLPSNLTTGMFMDHTENKFYIGTNRGLFIWDRNNNTSRVYDKDNSLLIDNLINHIDKNDEKHLIYVACEFGGFWMLNTQTGEERFYNQDLGNEIYPQLMGTNIASTYYDETDKKLYINIDLPGGVWIWDYNNLVPEYGDLRLADGSPAIDIANQSFLPPSITVDILGSPRLVDYASIQANNGLDVGAHEKTFTCQAPDGDFGFEKVNHTVTFNPTISSSELGCTVAYSWNFGDGQTSTEANPVHTYATPGTYSVNLQMTVTCGSCPVANINKSGNVVVENSLCGSIFCDPTGRVSIGTPMPAVGFRLSIAGKMIAEGAKIVVQSKWPDYVFDQQYNLMPISDLKKYISINKHLPEVPQAETVAETGVDVGEMSIILLKKTEEITLYLLQLDERLRKIEKKK